MIDVNAIVIYLYGPDHLMLCLLDKIGLNYENRSRDTLHIYLCNISKRTTPK